MTKPVSFYESIIGGSLGSIRDCIPFFESRCDSLLEVLFATAFVSTFNAFATSNSVTKLSDSIQLLEPFGCSPSNNGDSYAELKCQEIVGDRKWDFGIHTSTDNGGSESQLAYLIDIDGYGPHKKQREYDLKKSKLPNVRTIRIREELFKGPQEMAWTALWATIWHCGCCEDWGSGGPCSYCDKLKGRLIFNNVEIP